MVLLGSAFAPVGERTFALNHFPTACAANENGASRSVPSDHWWAPRRIGALDAWRLVEDRGAGQRIALIAMTAQTHEELEGTALTRAIPARKDRTNGTALATIAVSRPMGHIVGVAPGASVTPFSDIDSLDQALECGVWLLPNGWEETVPAEILQQASRAGIIVVAPCGASGTDEVLTVAAVNRTNGLLSVHQTARPDIAAPGCDVWGGAPGGEDVETITGHDVAAALVAGAAALFRARHGSDVLLAHAERNGQTVQEVFRQAVRATARCPNRWDDENGGAGMIDVAAVLRLPLGE